MSFLRRLFKGKIGHYWYERDYLARMIEEEKKHQYLKEIIEEGERRMAENPNFIDEVEKSESGCWMEQVYGKQQCKICDFVDDCPIKLQMDWYEFLKAEGKLKPANPNGEAHNGHIPSPDGSY
ncbi:hypothetical protein Ctha_1493 [Chloroherpeton thalassium ATCC 35110]|uniref:Uncharacterized protein n=1 Tax=Chloroherpeton thalassium (strain ATCC 35110 / GB-78) TaxID=517418 RepID=B3QS07_CHLT3|nr:hypothetical protein [Chloroherpeton thalassium]ACF13952.1 hypothetical protein Ctha_1493 [Chloroherpeton thalassium ATCC 35110]